MTKREEHALKFNNCLEGKDRVTESPAELTAFVPFYLKEQVTEKLWVFLDVFGRCFPESKPSEPVISKKTIDSVPSWR